MQRSPQGKPVDDAAFGLVQFFKTGVNVLFFEVEERHFNEYVSVFGFRSPQVVVKLLKFSVVPNRIGDEAKTFRAAAFDYGSQEKAV